MIKNVAKHVYGKNILQLANSHQDLTINLQKNGKPTCPSPRSCWIRRDSYIGIYAGPADLRPSVRPPTYTDLDMDGYESCTEGR